MPSQSDGERTIQAPSQPTPSSGLMTQGRENGSSAALPDSSRSVGTTATPWACSRWIVACLLAASRTPAAGVVSKALPACSTVRQIDSRMPPVSGAIGQTASTRGSVAARQVNPSRGGSTQTHSGPAHDLPGKGSRRSRSASSSTPGMADRSASSAASISSPSASNDPEGASARPAAVTYSNTRIFITAACGHHSRH